MYRLGIFKYTLQLRVEVKVQEEKATVSNGHGHPEQQKLNIMTASGVRCRLTTRLNYLLSAGISGAHH